MNKKVQGQCLYVTDIYYNASKWGCNTVARATTKKKWIITGVGHAQSQKTIYSYITHQEWDMEIIYFQQQHHQQQLDEKYVRFALEAVEIPAKIGCTINEMRIAPPQKKQQTTNENTTITTTTITIEQIQRAICLWINGRAFVVLSSLWPKNRIHVTTFELDLK